MVTSLQHDTVMPSFCPCGVSTHTNTHSQTHMNHLVGVLSNVKEIYVISGQPLPNTNTFNPQKAYGEVSIVSNPEHILMTPISPF